jgi:hypothetical protein
LGPQPNPAIDTTNATTKPQKRMPESSPKGLVGNVMRKSYLARRQQVTDWLAAAGVNFQDSAVGIFQRVTDR